SFYNISWIRIWRENGTRFNIETLSTTTMELWLSISVILQLNY
ncbi:24371_t:CDS:1, partial [Entrophospora sp. SA101]